MSAPTPEALIDYLAREVFSTEGRAEPRAPIAPAPAGEPVAIIGVACRFPGASTPEEFEALLAEGRDAVSPVPADRWNIDAFYDADPAVAGKMNVRSGGFLEQVDLFDAEFFGIMPREASAMDPQQRLLLEVAHEALENAGAAGEALAGSRVGVFVGASGNDHMMLQLNGGAPSGIDAYTGTGNLNSAIAGRLSCILGLRGPSLGDRHGLFFLAGGGSSGVPESAQRGKRHGARGRGQYHADARAFDFPDESARARCGRALQGVRRLRRWLCARGGLWRGGASAALGCTGGGGPGSGGDSRFGCQS